MNELTTVNQSSSPSNNMRWVYWALCCVLVLGLFAVVMPMVQNYRAATYFESHNDLGIGSRPGWLLNLVPDNFEIWLREHVNENHFFPFEDIYFVMLTNTSITDDDLVHPKMASQLEQIILFRITNHHKILKHLDHFPRLESVDIHDTPVSDLDIQYFKNVTNLSDLSIENSEVTDAGMIHFAKIPKLKTLYLKGANITDTGLVHLNSLTHLEELSLSNTKVTDVGLIHLKGMSNLKLLSLGGTQITNEGVAQIVGLKKIESLYLYNSNVTLASLEHLKKFPKLKILVLENGGRFYGQGKQIKAALPHCDITIRIGLSNASGYPFFP